MSAHNRRDIIDKTTVGIYHCYTKAVRGLFLTGYDAVQDKDFSYRRGWITDRTEEGLETIRHSTSHVLAQAVLELWPGSTFGSQCPASNVTDRMISITST